MGVRTLDLPANDVRLRFGASLDGTAEERVRSLPAGVPLAVMACASVIGLASALGCGLWLYPDSRGYIQMAVDIAERFDFTSELFLIRTPGYPVLLAVIFATFGRASPVVILVLQHVMVVAITVLVYRIAWELTANRRTALLAGLICSFNLELLAFANVIMTETLFTLVVTGCVLCLVRFTSRWQLENLAWASALSGVAYLVRPIGQVLIVSCLFAGGWVWWKQRRRLSRAAIPGVRGALSVAIACLIPAAIVSGPVLLHRAMVLGPQPAGWRFRTALYLRAAVVEGLDAPESAALQEIKRATAQALSDGVLAEGVDHRQRLRAVRQVLAHSHEASFAESSATIGQAGWDLFQTHSAELLTGTVTHAARTLLMVDGTYRHVPGGDSANANAPRGGGKLLDVASYDGMIRPYISEQVLHRYLPLDPTAGLVTAPWAWVMGRFDRLIVDGPGVPMLADSPRELAIVLCILGGLAGLLTPRRHGWMVLGLTVTMLVAVPAFFCGTVPRYAVPVHPLLAVCGAHVSIAVGRVVILLLRGRRHLPTYAETMAERAATLRG